jgi:hypothetical protein
MALHDLVSESLEIMCPSLSNLNSRASPALAWSARPSGPTTFYPLQRYVLQRLDLQILSQMRVFRCTAVKK